MPFSETQKISHIRELQNYLHRISQNDERMPVTIPSGLFDRRTSEAVSAFQAIYGLPVTGQVDSTTWDAIVAVYSDIAVTMPTMIDIFPTPDYVINASSPKITIEILQSMLVFFSDSFENFPKCSIINGIYDAQTQNCVRAAQALFLLEPTGFVDMQTWNTIVRYINFAVNRA